MSNTIIIPSLDPTPKLLQIVAELKNKKLTSIIIVDDGSKDQTIFTKLEELGYNVIHHAKNLGKGAALKTALKNAKKIYPKTKGYIFMDSDGQHSINDVLKVEQEMTTKNEIILGIRDFNNSNVPTRSKLGNKFSSFFFKLTTGKVLTDTQTGLRAIPAKYYELLVNTEGSRYEYEMNFMNYVALHNIPYETINIKTIYENNNKASHFHTIKDSIRIYHEPLKYLVVSLTSFIIDLTLFTFFNKTFNIIFLANIMARLLSGLYNYNMNKYWCFKSYSKNAFLKYLLLFTTNMFLSSILVKLFSNLSPHYTIIKVIVDSLIFIFSYIIQKKYIFKGDDVYENL